MSGLGDIEDREKDVGHVVGGQSIKQKTALRKSRPRVAHEFTTNTGFLTKATAFDVLPNNQNRTYLLIQNNSAAIIYLSFGGKADVFSGVQIAAGGYYEPYRVPKSSISIFAGASGLSGVVVESIKVN